VEFVEFLTYEVGSRVFAYHAESTSFEARDVSGFPDGIQSHDVVAECRREFHDVFEQTMRDSHLLKYRMNGEADDVDVLFVKCVLNRCDDGASISAISRVPSLAR